MTVDISCPECGESSELSGTPEVDGTRLTCETCGSTWLRDPTPSCGRCGSDDVQTVPLAIVERSRGTQLSIVGTRSVELCSVCDADRLAAYHANRPNPLMPDALPTVGPEQMVDPG